MNLDVRLLLQQGLLSYPILRLVFDTKQSTQAM